MARLRKAWSTSDGVFGAILIRVRQTVGKANATLGVNWGHSYVSTDKKATFCVYDAPSQDAIRQAADVKRPARRHDH